MATIASCADLATKQDTLLDCTGAALPANTQMAKCSDLTAYQLSLRDCTGAVIAANTQIAKCTDLATKQDALRDCTGAAIPANTQIAKCTDLATKQDALRDCTGAAIPANTQIAKCTDLAAKQDALQDCDGNALPAGTKVYVCGTISAPNASVGEVMQVRMGSSQTFGGRNFNTIPFNTVQTHFTTGAPTNQLSQSGQGIALKAGRKYRIDWSLNAQPDTGNTWTAWRLQTSSGFTFPQQMYLAAGYTVDQQNEATRTFYYEPTADTVLTCSNFDGTTASNWTFQTYLNNILTVTVIG